MTNLLLTSGLDCRVLDASEHRALRPFSYTGVAVALAIGLILYAYSGLFPLMLEAAISVVACGLQLWIAITVISFILFRRPTLIPVALLLRTTCSVVSRAVSLFSRILFPGGQVLTLEYDLAALETGERFRAIIYDPRGVAPRAGERVVVYGHQGQHGFVASSILRTFSSDGRPVRRPDGLVARQMPPVWVAVMLLVAAGILLLNAR